MITEPYIGITSTSDNIEVELRCPKCGNIQRQTIQSGHIKVSPRGTFSPAEWSLLRKHVLACFEETHRCQDNGSKVVGSGPVTAV
jgi:hypothetical protein